AEDEAEAARVEARRALADAYLRLREARATASALAHTVLPEARRTVADTVDAFRKGVLPTTDLLLARRTLMEIERERLDALERFHLAAADIKRLTGAPLARTNEGDGRCRTARDCAPGCWRRRSPGSAPRSPSMTRPSGNSPWTTSSATA